MNLALQKTEPQNTEPPRFEIRLLLSIWWIFQTVVFVIAGLFIAYCVFAVSKEVVKSSESAFIAVIATEIFSLLSIILMAYSIKNDRLARMTISLSLVALILISALANDFQEIQLTATAILAVTVTVFLVFQCLPKFAFIVMMGMFVLSVLYHLLTSLSAQWIFNSSSFMSHHNFLQTMLRFITFTMNPVMLLVIAPLVIACAYIPRMVTWSDWIWPAYRIRKPIKHKTAEQGFTLIELLIVIAIIGILFGGTFSVWTQNIVVHKQLIDRTQIHAILQSEMTALNGMDELPPPSDAQQPLPIALEEFGAQRMNGYYTVAQTGVAGLVEMQVHLLQHPGLPSETHFRLIARRQAAEATP
ncbi:MAG: prepilin-type N-terminal cleavage/methylation domain-containing protein [Candidatus Hinthialibacter antarcticus]|nr:prepilin-type N-terminal cleavage/methylation domain-containing protein [Candidatus Hinthialibacter antarcticus]